ncbi:MAG TPA: class I SAM-dependent methyltransferase [Gaiellales bacterium]|nr:class I SAM-dependent methyltransferase [Gaiellales bacterium]
MTATSDRKTHARSLFAGIAGDYDRWAQLLSFGQDRRWHDLMIDAIAPAAAGEDAVVADVATGTAAVAIALARRYPGCRVVGIDQSPEMLAGGARRVEAAGLRGRIELVEGQAERPPVEPGSVDALTHTYLLRYVDDPAATIAALAAAIRPGGMMASLEFGVPRGVAFPAWRVWTRAGLPLFGAPGGRAWVATGRFLGPSIERFWREHPIDEVLGWWAAAGMEQIRARRLSLGGGVIVWGTRAG